MSVVTNRNSFCKNYKKYVSSGELLFLYNRYKSYVKNMDDKNCKIFCFLICLLSIVLDQSSKFLIISNVPLNEVINIFPGFNIVHYQNVGISFGILSPSTIIEYSILLTMIIFVIIFLIYAFFKFHNVFEKILLSLLIGGAIGNLIDRIKYKTVIDFLDVYYGNYHWPAFNIADIFIFTSTCAIILFNLFKSSDLTK